MAGFKTFWLLLFLLALAACVPQKKQTQCGSNEAFNASLRTCVPIVGGPESYVTIDSYIPTTTLTKYSGSSAVVTFSITVANPYAQTYAVDWTRYYNGSTYNLSTSDQLEMQVVPSLLTYGGGPALGTHIITAKVKVGGKTVDTHNFELVITNNPTPLIVDNTVDPPDYAQEITHYSSAVTYSLDTKNNGATDVDDGDYAVVWTLHRNGVLISGFCADDELTNIGITDTNTADCVFDPTDPLISMYTTGNFMLRARVTHRAAPVQVTDEQVWSISMIPPALAKITARGFYDGVGGDPVLGDNGLVVAYDNTPYTTVGTAPVTDYNFVPCTGTNINTCTPVVGANQAEFCVTFASKLGSVPTSPSYIKVDWYLDGSNVYSENTSATTTATLCLTDGGSTVLDGVMFSNTSPTTPQLHTVTARVTDIATGLEYTASDMLSSLGTYPITWNVAVRPTNMAPAILPNQLVDTSGTSYATCTTLSGSAYTGCSAYSDQTFAAEIKIAATTGDDFYDFPGDQAHFAQTCRVYRNAVLVDTVAGVYQGVAGGYATYRCPVSFASYGTSGVEDVNALAFRIESELVDDGSPIDTTDKSSNTASWAFAIGKVYETNTAPVITLFSTDNTKAELADFDYTITVQDAEHDSFDYKVQYCINQNCATATDADWQDLTHLNAYGTITNTSLANGGTDLYTDEDSNGATPVTYSVQKTIQLPEDFLLNLTGVDCDSALAGDQGGGDELLESEVCDIYFRAVVTDRVSDLTAPNNPSTYTTQDRYLAVDISNYNPRPVFTVGLTSPNPTLFTQDSAWAFVGVPLYIVNQPSTTTTDTSNGTTQADGAAGSEDFLRYQWYARNQNTTPTWTKIDGATSASLTWSPSYLSNLGWNNVELILCMTDYPTAAVSEPNPNVAGESVCNSATPWSVTVRNNLVEAQDLSLLTTPDSLAFAATDDGVETATWIEAPRTLGTTISRATYTAMITNNNTIVVKRTLVNTTGTITNTSTDFVQFEGPSSSTATNIKNLSITGVDGKDLYIAYLANTTGSPLAYYPRVRRIDIEGPKAGSNTYPGTFGFDYDGLTTNTGTCTVCTYATNQVTFTGNTISGETIVLTTPKGAFTITVTPGANLTNQIEANQAASDAGDDLVQLINESTDPYLAGYYAVNAAGVVTIYGGEANDYYDGTRAADQVGQIYTYGNTWYLPFIDSSLSGASNDKISIVYGATDQVIGNTATTLLGSSAPLSSMPQVSQFDNDFYYDGVNGHTWFSVVTKTGSKAYIYHLTDLASVTGAAVMTAESAYNTQIAMSGSYVFMGLYAAGNKFKIGVYDTNVSILSEKNINDSTFVASGTDTDDYFNYTSIPAFGTGGNYRLFGYNGEARIVAVSKGASASEDYRLYMANVRRVASVWTISCGSCAQIGTQTGYVSPFVLPGVSNVLSHGNSTNYLLSWEGTYAGQGLRNTAAISWGQMDDMHDGAPSYARPYVGIYNIENEGINATSLPATDNGLWRPSFLKN